MSSIRIASALRLALTVLAPVSAVANPNTSAVNPPISSSMKGVETLAPAPSQAAQRGSSAEVRGRIQGGAFAGGMGMGGMVVVDPIKPALHDTRSAGLRYHIDSWD